MMTRREAFALAGGAALAAAAPSRAPIVNGAEHAWVMYDPRFPINPALANCPDPPSHEYSAEFLLAEMKTWGVDHVVISHVCYYGMDNRYPSYMVKRYPKEFAAIGLLVGYRLHPPADPANALRLERLVKDDGLVGLRLSPIYDPNVVWLNDRVCDPLWKKAAELGCVFNVFLAPHQVKQLADMAERHPGVNVVVDHVAKIDISAPDSEGFGPLLDMARLPNVYIRTSLHNPSKTKETPYRDVWPFLQRLYDRYGPKRMVWANFFELLIIKDLIPFFKAEDKEWILGRTAHRLYKFGQSGA
jgi:L-fuconolactonase